MTDDFIFEKMSRKTAIIVDHILNSNRKKLLCPVVVWLYITQSVVQRVVSFLQRALSLFLPPTPLGSQKPKTALQQFL